MILRFLSDHVRASLLVLTLHGVAPKLASFRVYQKEGMLVNTRAGGLAAQVLPVVT